MSYALTRLTGDGSTTTFTIGFTYRDKADLVVKVDGVAQAINTDYTIATGGTQITFTSAPANNAAIFFQRATSQNTRLVDYTAGAVFKESDLDTDSIQGFYMSQEAIDIANEAIGKDASNRFDAQGIRIINVADPVDNTDAVNKQFISTNLPNINTVAGIADDVTTVAGISSDVTAVAADASDIGTVSTDIANVNVVATDIANVNAVAADASDIGTVSSNMADVNTVAASIGDVNSYANTYFISATAPSSPTVGDLWFDTTLSVMKVYKGASGGWQNTGADSIVNGTANRYNYVVGTASGSYTGSTTSFPAAYDVGYVDVYLNGVKQVLGTDFTATDGATVVLSTAASTSDAVDIVAYGTFELGPTSTSTESFTGNGTTTSFTLSSDPGGAGSGCVVYIDGVYQERTGYSINGDALEFTEAPPANASIEVLKFTVNSIGSADSTAVTFTQDGTGAVQRSVDSKLNESVSVKDFGAVGDGTTDDTDAIQAAIDYCGSSGTVYLPPGSYKIMDELSVPAGASISFKGDGRSSTFINSGLTSPDSTKSMIRYYGTGLSPNQNVTIEGIRFSAIYFGYGVYVDNGFPNLVVKELEIFKPLTHGLVLEECWASSVYDVEVDGDNHTSTYGILATNANNVSLYNCRVYNMQNNAQSTGIGATSCENFSIFGGNIENCPRGIYATVGGTFDGPILIEGVYFEPRGMSAFDAGHPNDHIKVLGDSADNGSVTVSGCLFQAGNDAVDIAYNAVSAQNIGTLTLIGNVWQKAKYTNGGEGENYFIDVDSSVNRVIELGNSLISTNLGNVRQIDSSVKHTHMNGDDTTNDSQLSINKIAFDGGAGDVLSDYEVGNFTPYYSGGNYTFTYNKQKGQYTKIGNRVWVDLLIYLHPSSAPSGSVDGPLFVEGLPFQYDEQNDEDVAGGVCHFKQLIKGTQEVLAARMDNGASNFKFYDTLATNYPEINYIQASGIGANARFRLSFTYTTNS